MLTELAGILSMSFTWCEWGNGIDQSIRSRVTAPYLKSSMGIYLLEKDMHKKESVSETRITKVCVGVSLWSRGRFRCYSNSDGDDSVRNIR